MRNYLKLLLLILTIFTFLKVDSQTITVTDIQGNPIEGIEVSHKSFFTSTNKVGKVEIKELDTLYSISFFDDAYQYQILSYKELKDIDFKVTMHLNVFNLETLIVSADKWGSDRKNTPRTIKQITKENIQFYQYTNTADLLQINGDVYIQKSQLGGGSPMIRGMSANRVLITVDGVRMNNAIFRSGNLQNVIAIDPKTIEFAEVVLGPNAVTYGSDALGGVMAFSTESPRFNTTDSSLKAKTNLGMSYGSAASNFTSNLSLSLSKKKFASYTALSYNGFGDLRMGSKGYSDYQRTHIVKQYKGVDSTTLNDNPNLQRSSGYKQINLTQKFKLKLGKTADLQLNGNYALTTNTPRYDRLIVYNGSNLKYADWFYGPQEWLMLNAQLNIYNKTKLYDQVKIVPSFQSFKESRHSRKFRDSVSKNQFENVLVGGLNIDLIKKINKKNQISYGADFYHNLVKSSANNSLTNNISNVAIGTRYPNNSIQQLGGAYINYQYIPNSKISLAAGIRYSFNFIKGSFDSTYYKLSEQNFSLFNNIPSLSFGVAYKPLKSLQLNLNLSSGFRAPNIDDLAKVFDSGDGIVVIPNNKLNPESAYTGEIGLLYRLKDVLTIEANTFYTYLNDAIVRGDFKLEGQDSIIYDGEMSKVQAQINADFASIYGFSVNSKVNLVKGLFIEGQFSWMKGFDSKNNSLRHVPPIFGKAGIGYAFKKLFKTKLEFNFNGEISTEELAPSEQDKPSIYKLDEDGAPYSPSWYTLDYFLEIIPLPNLGIKFSVGNILDIRYRPYSSGIVAPGRDFRIGISYSFN